MKACLLLLALLATGCIAESPTEPAEGFLTVQVVNITSGVGIVHAQATLLEDDIVIANGSTEAPHGWITLHAPVNRQILLRLRAPGYHDFSIPLLLTSTFTSTAFGMTSSTSEV